MDVNNTLINEFKAYFGEDKCIACDADIEKKLIYLAKAWKADRSDRMDLYRCINCGLVYTHPFLNHEEEKKLYESYPPQLKHQRVIKNEEDFLMKIQELFNNFFGKIYFSTNLVRLKKILSSFIFPRMMQTYPIFSSNKNKKLKILDVGCGDGHFLYSAKRFGLSCYGTEYNEKLIHLLKKMGINATINIEDFIGKEVFDIIRINHVLEHVKHPGKLLKVVKQLLKTNGELIIGVPNFDTLAKIFKEYYWLYLPYHRFHFNKKSITKILENNDFSVLYYKTKSFGSFFSSLSKIYKIDKMQIPLRIIDSFISIFLDLFCYGDGIEIYAKKRRL